MKNKIKIKAIRFYRRNKLKIKAFFGFNLLVGLLMNIIFISAFLHKANQFIIDPVGIEPVEAKIKIPTPKNEPSIKDWVKKQIENSGLIWEEAECIIANESGWDQWQTNWNTNGTVDYGLWQINSVHKKTISVADRYDYKKATQWAITKRLNDGNWCAWVASGKCGICK